GLADVLLHNPPVLVLDEPTVGLDPAQIRQMRELIRELGQDRTVVLSSHLLAEVEQLCDHLLIIAGGKIVASGTAEELREKVVGPSRIIAEVAGAQPDELREAVGQLPGIRRIDLQPRGEWQRMVIASTSRQGACQQIHELASRRGWRLRELRREVGSLEDYFVQITYQQNVRGHQRGGRRA
ncbi:MAG: AAA family ATPase, partial [Planctomycetota bacterium]